MTTGSDNNDGLFPAPPELAIPPGVDRRAFLMRSAVIGNPFLDKIAGAMLATVKAGLAEKEAVLPGPIELHSKAAAVWERAQDDKPAARRTTVNP